MVYDTIKRVDNNLSLERSPGSGSHHAISQKIKDKIIEENVNEIGRTYRSIGHNHKIDDKTVKDILIKAGIKKKKRIKAPKSNENQQIRQKTCLGKLRRGLMMPSNDSEIIFDDESYFTLDGSDFHGNDHYFAFDGLPASDLVKYKTITKFPSKVMVWLAISSRGISQPFIINSGNAINAQTYKNECIKKRLVKFINKYHSDNNYIFWPDLASSHYAKVTLADYERLNIKVVPKDQNPPNVPQLRPIENYWAILKQRVYRNGWRAESHEDLIKKIKLELRKTSAMTCQNLVRHVKTNIRIAADHGALAVIN